MGVDFTRSIMIGRQGLHLDERELAMLLRAYGHRHVDARGLLDEAGGFAEPLLKSLGAADVDSLDASDFEGATIVHDLNLPLPEQLRRRYSAVIDSGSLEHVFDFPEALRSCMELAEIGGHLLAITPTNNLSGHGFYQFSPDLFYRVFSKQNGFETREMVVFEARPRATWYRVADAARVRHRVELRNAWETYLAVLARRVEAVPVLSTPPQQSDYAAAWSGSPFVYEPSAARQLARRIVPGPVRRAIRRRYRRPGFVPFRDTRL